MAHWMRAMIAIIASVAALMIGAIGAFTLHVFANTSKFCTNKENLISCTREWILVGGTIITAISIGILIWQIVVARRQVFSFAVERLLKRNYNLQIVRHRMTVIRRFLLTFQNLFNEEPRNAWDMSIIIKNTITMLDNDELINAVTHIAMPKELHDEVLEINIDWNRQQASIEALMDTLDEAILVNLIYDKVPKSIESEIDRISRDIVAGSTPIIHKIDKIRPQLRSIFINNMNVLVQIDAGVAKEIKRVVGSFS